MRPCHTVGTILAALGLACAAQAAELDPATWTVADLATGERVTGVVTDERLETAWSGGGGQQAAVLPDAAKGLLIDLGVRVAIHRVYWGGNTAHKGQDVPFPVDVNQGVTTRVAILIGDSPETLKPACAELPVAVDALYETNGKVAAGASVATRLNTEGDARFPVRMARYVRLEAYGLPADATWIIGEIEVYGFKQGEAESKREAVVLPAAAHRTLALAARDLSYYLGEMLGRPVPIIKPEDAAAFKGPVFRLADLKELAGSYAAMQENLKTGALPSSPVNVETDGKDIVVKAWPYRNVLDSVWAFLESQGVRWTYPDPHGDFVPKRTALDLGVLPLRYAPSTERIHANFGIESFRPTLQWQIRKGGEQPSEGYLYFWRNHWSRAWSRFAYGGGDEVPLPQGPKDASAAAKLLKEEFHSGFEGYPHNNCGITRRDLEAHPEWMGMKREVTGGPGKRSPDVTPCYSNEGLKEFLVAKAVAWAALYPETPQRFNLLPTDAALDCECDDCLALNQPLVRPDIPYCAHPTYYASDAYYRFIGDIAQRCAEKSPTTGFFALAYANVFAPPRKLTRLPDNVTVEVCLYGHMNLPPDSPRNAKMRAYLEEWAEKCGKLETYGYNLLNEDSQQWPMPLPLVSATVAWAKLQHRLGALTGGTQAAPEMLPYCPWNFYAYPRIRWNVDTTAEAMLQEFFTSHFRESGEAMLAYYRTAENYHARNDLSLYGGGYNYRLSPGAFPFHVLAEMSGHLARAEAAAAGWVVRRRVASMRQGFQWLLEKTGIGAKRLADSGSIAVAGPGRPPLVIAVKNADVFPSTGARGDFCLQNGIRVGHIVRFAEDGEYLISCSGTGFTDPGHKKERLLTAYVGNQMAPAQVVPDGQGGYAFSVRVTQGVWEVGVKSASNGEGPFFIKEFMLKAKE